MTQTGKSCKFLDQTNWPRRALLCLAPDNICRMPRRASHDLKIFPRRRSFIAVGTSPIGRVLVVTNPAFAAEQASESSTTSATWLLGDRVRFIWFTRSIAARVVGNISMRTCPTTLCPRLTILIALSPWPCGSSWKTACPIKPPAGTCGATTEFSFPMPPSKTGWRPGGKKGGGPNGRRLSRLGSR